MPKEHDSVLHAHGQTFLGSWSRQLAELILQQGGDMLRAAGSKVDPLCVSTLLQIQKDGETTVADIGRHLGLSHQLVRQRTMKLEKAGLIESVPSRTDARKRLLVPRAEARAEIEKVLQVMARVDRAVHDLYRESGIELLPHIKAAVEALRRTPLNDRANRTDP